MTTTSRQPGWYDDPNDSNAQRYWDGQDWTPHRQRKQASRPAARQQPPPQEQPAAPAQPSGRSTPPPPPPRNEPPPPPPSNVPPPPPGQAQPPAASRVSSEAIKKAAIVAGVALVLVIAAYVAGRVQFGAFWPGILIVAAIAAIIAFFTIRSQRPVAHKAVVVAAIVAVVVVAIPASSKVVFPVYSHFFGEESGSGAQAGPGGSGPGGSHHRGSHHGGGTPTSGILTLLNTGKRTYGFIDPSSGEYSEVVSFDSNGATVIDSAVGVSPDLTKLAATKSADGQQSAGWIDSSGNFTQASPKVETGTFGGSPPSFDAIGFDDAGNFYYATHTGTANSEAYKLAPGSTTNPQKVSSMLYSSMGVLNYDGSMAVGCEVSINWLGPNNSVTSGGTQIYKETTGRDAQGCPTQTGNTPLLPKTNNVSVSNAVGNHDGTKVAFLYSGSTGSSSDAGLYIVDADGSSQPTKVNVTDQSAVSQMTFLRWK